MLIEHHGDEFLHVSVANPVYEGVFAGAHVSQNVSHIHQRKEHIQEAIGERERDGLRSILAKVRPHLSDYQLARVVGHEGAQDRVPGPVADVVVARGARDVGEEHLAVGQEGGVGLGMVDEGRRSARVLRLVGRLELGLGRAAGSPPPQSSLLLLVEAVQGVGRRRQVRTADGLGNQGYHEAKPGRREETHFDGLGRCNGGIINGRNCFSFSFTDGGKHEKENEISPPGTQRESSKAFQDGPIRLLFCALNYAVCIIPSF